MLLATLLLTVPARGEDAPVAPAPPAPAAIAPDLPLALPDPPPEAATPDEREVAAADDPADLYLEALDAWKGRNFPRTLSLATKAVNTDPLFGEAWLLRSYAHLRLHEPERALTSVRLARESERDDVRAAARALEARLTQDYVRDSVSLWTGLGPIVELDYGSPRGRVGLNLGVGAPVWRRLSARAEVQWIALDPGELRVAGSKAAALASWTLPIGSGRWSFTPAAGPSLWIATGQYWADGVNPYLGLRVDLDLDVRLTPAMGLYLAASSDVYPGQLADLDWTYTPGDVRTGLRLWFWKV